MSRSTRLLLALVAAGACGGCMSMSDAECRSANWYEVGERDGLLYGQRPQIDQWAHLCSAHGVQASEKDYMAGWTDGYREFIRRSTGADCCGPN